MYKLNYLNMKIIFKILTVVLISYLFTAFITIEVDFRLWDRDERLGCAYLSMISSLLIFAYAKMVDSEI